MGSAVAQELPTKVGRTVYHLPWRHFGSISKVGKGRGHVRVLQDNPNDVDNV